MKLIHLSDLHLGKKVNGFSMIEDQKYILIKILNIIDAENPDGVLIAGDIYDKSVPPAEAVELFDDFLVQLAKRRLQVFIISGNHDSPERLAFGNRLIDTTGIHLSPVYHGKVQPYILEDTYGKVAIYMLPFIKPAIVRRIFPEEMIESYTDALKLAIENMDIDSSNRNILITHQFVTGATKSESEEISVGGTDNVDAFVFEDFDYVALGHIHGPQNIQSERIRYCGTPLKYSFSEADHKKSVTVIELKEKGNFIIRTVPLIPLRDMVKIKGKYEEVMRKSFYENTSYGEDYVHITLTDEEEVIDAISKLRIVYHNIMGLSYENSRTKYMPDIRAMKEIENKSPLVLFSEFFEQQNGIELTEEQSKFMESLMENMGEDKR